MLVGQFGSPRGPWKAASAIAPLCSKEGTVPARTGSLVGPTGASGASSDLEVRPQQTAVLA